MGQGIRKMYKELYTVPEVARMLRLTQQHVSRLCRIHEIGFKTPRAYILREGDIEKLKERRTVSGPVPKGKK